MADSGNPSKNYGHGELPVTPTAASAVKSVVGGGVRFLTDGKEAPPGAFLLQKGMISPGLQGFLQEADKRASVPRVFLGINDIIQGTTGDEISEWRITRGTANITVGTQTGRKVIGKGIRQASEQLAPELAEKALEWIGHSGKILSKFPVVGPAITLVFAGTEIYAYASSGQWEKVTPAAAAGLAEAGGGAVCFLLGDGARQTIVEYYRRQGIELRNSASAEVVYTATGLASKLLKSGVKVDTTKQPASPEDVPPPRNTTSIARMFEEEIVWLGQ